MRFTTMYNYDPSPFVEVNNEDSMTEPDQSLSVKEIIRRFSAGTLLPEDFQKSDIDDYYNGDIDSDAGRILDLTDIEELGRNLDDVVKRASDEAKGGSKG